MYRNQKQVMDSFVRVRSFLDPYPTTGALTYARAREMLDDVVQRLRAHAGAQLSGRELSRAEHRRQAEQIALLFDQYMRPLVTIARAQSDPESDVGLAAALRMPKLPLGPTKVLAACDGMIEAARPFEAATATSPRATTAGTPTAPAAYGGRPSPPPPTRRP